MIKYVIISPVRNEEAYLERTIKSVISQTVPPSEFIIIDDGSTDKTRDIINKYMAQHDWIKCFDREPKPYWPGAGVVQAFYDGFNKITVTDWDYVVKMDGDLEFDADYFELIFEKFNANPKMGMASGKTYVPEGDKLTLEPCTDDHVRGPIKTYKRKCFDEIGGLPETIGWDTLDEHKAQMLGWETRSYGEIVIKHLRRMSYNHKDWSRGRMKFGISTWFLGYHPLWVIGKAGYNVFFRPFLIGGIAIIIGYLKARLSGKKQYDDPELLQFIRKKQLNKIKKALKLKVK